MCTCIKQNNAKKCKYQTCYCIVYEFILYNYYIIAVIVNTLTCKRKLYRLLYTFTIVEILPELNDKK